MISIYWSNQINEKGGPYHTSNHWFLVFMGPSSIVTCKLSVITM